MISTANINNLLITVLPDVHRHAGFEYRASYSNPAKQLKGVVLSLDYFRKAVRLAKRPSHYLTLNKKAPPKWSLYFMPF